MNRITTPHEADFLSLNVVILASTTPKPAASAPSEGSWWRFASAQLGFQLAAALAKLGYAVNRSGG